MKLLFLFVVVPAVELALLIEIGSRIGTLATLALIVLTGVVGASLARSQGLGVLRRLQEESAAGRVPARTFVDGAMVLVAGALLMTPGVLTDAVGFALLVPAVRDRLAQEARRRFERAVREGRVEVRTFGGPGGPGAGPFGAGDPFRRPPRNVTPGREEPPDLPRA